MDNITHTLVGEAIARTGPRSVDLEERRRWFVPTLAIGSNLPDLDLLYTLVVRGKLDYLLHHRGYTHTLVGAVVLAILTIAWHEWRSRQRSQRPCTRQRLALLGAALLGPLLHIAMDATNSYGVHPYWPIDDRWRYGDAVFIIEPLFWAAAAPLVLLLRSKWSRAFVALALVAGAVLGVATRMVLPPFIAVYVALVITMLLIARRWPQRAAIVGVLVWLACTAMFVGAGHIARSRLTALAATLHPHEQVLDAVHSPMPMNPLCWELMLVQAGDAEHFTLRRAVLSLAPQWLDAASCPTRGLTLPISAPLQPVAAANSAELQWYGELTLPRAPLRQLADERCEVSALLQFARVPWFMRQGSRWLVGDLRYDREPQPGFAEIGIDPETPQHCPLWSAPWIAPRVDLLR